ncbi:MAG: porin family protein [Prevotellaceae bacterium]|nr:porin family protein [Prevotellaceae bacterium]
MKKNILLAAMTACLLFSMSNEAKAQYNGHEFEVGIGAWSSNDIIFSLADMVVSVVPLDVSFKDHSSTGAFYAGYKYLFTERFGLGATLAYGRDAFNCYSTADAMVGRLNRNHFTFALEADYKYWQKGIWNVYGLAGVGVTYFNQAYKPNVGAISKNHKWHPNIQLTPVGIKAGNAFGGFAEVGIGYKGVINAGLFLRL